MVSIICLILSEWSSKYASKNGNHMGNSSGDGDFVLGSEPPTPPSEGEILQSSNLKNFGFSDLMMATRNFRPDSVLGEGRFSSVFKGCIDEVSFTAAKPRTGTVIAVRKLHQESFQGHGEWLVSFSSSTCY